MGRLAVILGSNALGPGGDEIAAAAAEHGAAIVQRHGGAGDPYRPPAPDRPRRQPAAAGRAGLRPGPGDLLGRLAAARARRSARLLCPDDFIALHLGALDLRRPARPLGARLRRRAGGRK